MITERRVTLRRSGRDQILLIPQEFELPGEVAIISKHGDRLIIEPTRRGSLLAVLAQLEPIEEDSSVD